MLSHKCQPVISIVSNHDLSVSEPIVMHTMRKILKILQNNILSITFIHFFKKSWYSHNLSQNTFDPYLKFDLCRNFKIGKLATIHGSLWQSYCKVSYCTASQCLNPFHAACPYSCQRSMLTSCWFWEWKKNKNCRLPYNHKIQNTYWQCLVSKHF